MRADGRGGVLEELRLDGPHDERGLRERRVGRRDGPDAVRAAQPLALFAEGLDDHDRCAAAPAGDKPADDGAGHVAAADECQELFHV